MSLCIVSPLTHAHLDDVMELFKQAWWTSNREKADVKRLLGGPSLSVGLQNLETGQLVAYCRFLTDGVYRALLMDVIVDRDYQGNGLGQTFIQKAIAETEIADIPNVEVYACEKHHGFYERNGFMVPQNTVFMRHTKVS